MNKSMILNATWVAIATAAFLFGRFSVDSTNDPGNSDDSVQGKSSTGHSGSQASGGGDGSGSRISRSPSDSRAGTGVTVGQFLNESDPLLANKLFADLILEMDEGSARAIFDALRKGGRGADSAQQMALFLQAWGKLNGAAAMAAVAELGRDPRRRGQAGIAAIRGWASVNPEAAKAYLATVENDWEKNSLAHGIVSGLASSDPGAATTFVFQMDTEQRESIANIDDQRAREGIERARAYAFDRQLDTIANAQIERGMNIATAWAEGLPEGAIKASAFDRVAENFAREDPEAAAEWVKSHAGNEYAERAIREVAEELGRDDPSAAVRWLAELPDESQSRAIHQSMERWTKEDPVAAGEYLTAMPASATRDAAVRSFANELDGSEPRVAADWAGTIRDEQVRLETLSGVARSWIRSDPEEARAWLPSSGLPAEQQEQVLQDANRRQDFRDRIRDFQDRQGNR
jgi:hypothetical protein